MGGGGDRVHRREERVAREGRDWIADGGGEGDNCTSGEVGVDVGGVGDVNAALSGHVASPGDGSRTCEVAAAPSRVGDGAAVVRDLGR